MVDTPRTAIFKMLQSDYLLVKVIEDDADASDVNGIISPYGRHAEIPLRARVLDAGDGYVLPCGELARMCAKIGDIVMLQFGAGTPVRIQGESYLMVLDRDIFGVTYRAH